jgi:hypothetical protein
LKGILVPIAVFVCITYGLGILTDAVMRHLLVRSNPSEEVVRAVLREESRIRREGALRWGLLLSFAAAALAILEWTGWTEFGPGPVALVVGAIGLANLVFYAIGRRFKADLPEDP